MKIMLSAYNTSQMLISYPLACLYLWYVTNNNNNIIIIIITGTLFKCQCFLVLPRKLGTFSKPELEFGNVGF